jgi:hypothetical protein
MAGILDTFIKGDDLPELPISVENESIINLSVALLVVGVMLILIAFFVNK